MPFNAVPYQPLDTFFNLTMGGMSNIYQDPNIPIDFNLTIERGGSSNFEMTLFDWTGYEVEPNIWRSRDPITGIPGGTFSFGYKGKADVASDELSFQLASYGVKWNKGDFTVNMVGTSLLTPLISSNQYNGTIPTLLQDWCNIHGCTLNISPDLGTEYMQEIGVNNSNTTKRREMRHSKYMDESDWAYILRIVSFCRDKSGKGGYAASLSSKGGQPTLNITRPDENSSPSRYIIQDADTNVVNWEPNIDFAGCVWDANDFQVNTHQALTGDQQKMVFQPGVTKQYQITDGNAITPLTRSLPQKLDADKIVYFCSEAMQQQVKSSATRMRTGGQISPLAGMNPHLDSHLKTWLMANNAELTIIGDPTILETGVKVEVVFDYPKNLSIKSLAGQPHYSGGEFYIDTIHHSNHTGEFLTTLSLQRATMAISPDQQQ